jgi:hypothetical protein
VVFATNVAYKTTGGRIRCISLIYEDFCYRNDRYAGVGANSNNKNPEQTSGAGNVRQRIVIQVFRMDPVLRQMK